MSVPHTPMRRIVVAGGGQLGILAAIGMKRALPRCEVLVIALRPDRAAFADFAGTALPFTNLLHSRLGIDEAAIVQSAGGSHRLVTRYLGWGGAGQIGAMAYGAVVDPSLRTGFARAWGAGPKNATGARAPGSLAEVLADAGRFAVPAGDEPGPLAEIDYALRWHPAAYRDLLIHVARQIGISHVTGEIAGIQPDGAGGIAALSIDGAEPIEADLFLDCSGPKARLLSALPAYRIHDWSAVLPVREVALAKPGQAMLAVEDRNTLLPQGWRAEFAGRDGLQVALGLSPEATQDAALFALGAEPMIALPVAAGRAAAPWLGNVIALGDAAARFEPLGFLNLDLAHRQLDLLLEMLPGTAIEPLERSEYNRRSGLMMDAVRDTLGAHYAAPAARAVFGSLPQSAELSLALDQFERRGRMPFREEAPLLSGEFQSLLAALGFRQGTSPQVLAMGSGPADEAARAFAARAQQVVALAPRYDEWMAATLRGGPALHE